MLYRNWTPDLHSIKSVGENNLPVYKLFSTYFHKLSVIGYENNLEFIRK